MFQAVIAQICFVKSIIFAHETALFCCSAILLLFTRVEQCQSEQNGRWFVCGSVVYGRFSFFEPPIHSLTTHEPPPTMELRSIAGSSAPRSPSGLTTFAACTLVSQVAPSERAGEILSPEAKLRFSPSSSWKGSLRSLHSS